MMRKITEKVVNAFLNNEGIHKDNTDVKVEDEYIVMYLFDNAIARKHRLTGVIEVSNAGWTSNTTKERLNGIMCARGEYQKQIHQVNYKWYWKDAEPFPNNKWVEL